METLPCPDTPIPAALTWHRCQRTIDVLYPWMPREDDAGTVTPLLVADVLCADCRIEREAGYPRDKLASDFARFREVRGRVGLVSGTLVVQYRRADDATKWAHNLSMLTCWVASSCWPKVSSLKTHDLSAGFPPVVFGLLAAVVWDDRAPNLKQFFWGDWHSPEADYRLETLGWNDPAVKRADWGRLPDMTRFFREFDPGRPSVCYRKILGAIRALQAEGREPSLNAVARQIHGWALTPRDSVKQCLDRERKKGRPTRWQDVLRDAC